MSLVGQQSTIISGLGRLADNVTEQKGALKRNCICNVIHLNANDAGLTPALLPNPSLLQPFHPHTTRVICSLLLSHTHHALVWYLIYFLSLSHIASTPYSYISITCIFLITLSPERAHEITGLWNCATHHVTPAT